MLGLPKGFKTQHFTSAVSLNLLTPILLNVTPGESPRNFELKQTCIFDCKWRLLNINRVDLLTCRHNDFHISITLTVRSCLTRQCIFLYMHFYYRIKILFKPRTNTFEFFNQSKNMILNITETSPC